MYVCFVYWCVVLVIMFDCLCVIMSGCYFLLFLWMCCCPHSCLVFPCDCVCCVCVCVCVAVPCVYCFVALMCVSVCVYGFVFVCVSMIVYV